MGYQGFAAENKAEERYQDYPPGEVPSAEEEPGEEGQSPEHQAVADRIRQVTLLEPDATCGVGGQQHEVDHDEEDARRVQSDGEDERDRDQTGHEKDDSLFTDPSRGQGIRP